MAPFLNAKGQPVKMSFLDLFGPSRPSRGGKRAPKTRSKKKEPSSSEASPQSAAATKASTEQSTPPKSESVEWSRVEEMALLGMKAQNMAWKEIEDALPGKNQEVIKNKYKELNVNAPASSKPKEEKSQKEEAKKGEEKTEEKKEEVKAEGKKEGAQADETKGTEKSKENTEEKKGRKESAQGKKHQKGQKGKGKTQEAKVKPEEAKSEKTKGFLFAKARAEDIGKMTTIHGHPVIFIDDQEELSYDELLFLYGLHARYDEIKWITVDSKFFDKYGKRVGAAKLKEKLASTF